MTRVSVLAVAALLATAGNALAQPNWLAWKNPDPNRPLSPSEAADLVSHAVALLDKAATQEDRAAAAAGLGRTIHHRAALPALGFVLRDEGEQALLRVKAMHWMLWIGLPESLGEVIGLLRSCDRKVRFHAEEILRWQSGSGDRFGYDFTKPPEESAAAIKRWEEWWDAKKDTFELNPLGILVPRQA